MNDFEALAAQLAAKHIIPETDIVHPEVVMDSFMMEKMKEPNYVPYCLVEVTCGRVRRTRYGFWCPSCGNKMNYDMTHYDGNKNVQYIGEPAKPADAAAGLPAPFREPWGARTGRAPLADRLPAPYHRGSATAAPRTADQERADWNAKVDAKKPAKKGRK
jgi:hypothetical protein